MQESAQAQAKVRLFFALWPEPRLRSALARLAMDSQAVLGGRAMRPDTLHLTLLFIGEVAREQGVLASQAADVVALSPFELQLDALQCWKHNRIAYAAVANAGVAPLQQLAEALREAVARSGVPFDGKGFVPHVTLLRNINQFRPMQPLAPLAWPVREFVLVESRTEPEGARYRVLQRWPLRG